MFVDPDGQEFRHLLSLGLTETFRRAHPGQGTRNVCFCFDNMFLELLWVVDAAEIAGPAIARTRLLERSRWRADRTNPFGISWRGPGSALPGMRTWSFCPPYLPDGASIEVAEESEDVRQPMMFRSPGTTAPAHWPPDRRGVLQHPAGLGRVSAIRLSLPSHVVPSTALSTLASSTILRLGASERDDYGLELEVATRDSTGSTMVRLPCHP